MSSASVCARSVRPLLLNSDSMTDFTKIYAALQKELDVKNIQAVPRITKVVLSVGVGKNRDNKQYIEAVARDLAAITGQYPRQRHARQAIAGFNVRQGNLVGYQVTLRGRRMKDFIERFVNVTLPRVRDFRGLPTRSLDGQGNLSVGVTEQLAFPEIQADQTDIIFGVEATFVTSARDNAQAESMFRALGFPLSDEVEEALPVARRAARVAKKEARATK